MGEIRFSQLHTEPEKTSCLQRRAELDFWRYGSSGGGESFGVLRRPVFADPGYYEYEAALVDTDGRCFRSTLLKRHYYERLPEVMLFCRADGSLLWQLGGEIFRWDCLDFSQALRVNDRLPEGARIEDAVLHEDGSLEVSGEGFPDTVLSFEQTLTYDFYCDDSD